MEGEWESIHERHVLDAEEERFRLLIKNSADMVFRRTLDGRFVEVSAPGRELLGSPAEEIVGTSITDWIHPEDLDDFETADRDLASWGRAVLVLRLKRADGGTFWAELTSWLLRDDGGQPIEVRGFFRESQERGRGELLRMLQERARSVIDSANDAFVSVDDQGLVIDWNPSAQRLFGFTREEVIGRPPTDTFLPTDQRPCLDRLLAGEESKSLGRQMEVTANRQDGRQIPVELAVWPMQMGSTLCFNAFIRDITERKQAVQAVAAARDQAMEASRVKSQFMATMSHEIRTPMNGVIGLSELLLDTQLDTVQRRYAVGIHDAGLALLGLINDILDFSKLEAGKLVLDETVFDPHLLVEEVVALVAQSASARNLELLADSHPDLPTALRADAGRLRQVLLNLASNAVKFTHEGEVVIRARPEDDDLYFEVVDTGIGIDPANQERMFDAFSQADSSTTRRYGGTGLGLAICRRLVDAMGGTIGVRSRLGAGSTFWFTVPLRRPDNGEQPPAQPQPASLRGLHVLVVDDNETNRLILENQLNSWSMRPTTVESGPQALLELHRAAAAGRSYELAIVDHHMPEMDGLELARRITTDPVLARVRLLLLTSGSPATTAELRAAGIRDCLSKPVRQSELHDCLAQVMAPETTAGTPSPTPAKPTPAVHKAHLLLVEDNEINQTVALGILDRLGYSADVAPDGVEALRMTAAGTYQAVLMDCRMPRMDGYTATQEMRRREGPGQHLPIIAMTASALPEDQERCLASGMDDYVSKPITAKDLDRVLVHWTQAEPEGEPQPAGTAAGTEIGQRLDDLRGEDTPDNRELVVRLIDSFLNQAPQLVAELLAAVRSDDVVNAEEHAHALRGAAGNMGARELAECAAALEELARNGLLTTASPEAVRLPRLLDQVRDALQASRAGYLRPPG